MKAVIYMRVGNPGLSNHLPHAPRSYAPSGDFHSKKVKKVCDINLTHAGFGKLDLRRTFDIIAGRLLE